MQLTHSEIVAFLLSGIRADVLSISIIGSYLIDMRVRAGSDIDLVVVVKDLDTSGHQFQTRVTKDAYLVDYEGTRKEIATNYGGTILDLTLLDKFNTPNSPARDNYENHIGWCVKAYTIYGKSPAELFDVETKINDYRQIQNNRLRVVEGKIFATKQKLALQEIKQLRTLYDLQCDIFRRECMSRTIFNALGVKYCERAIPGFTDIFARELEDCGVYLSIRSSKESEVGGIIT